MAWKVVVSIVISAILFVVVNIVFYLTAGYFLVFPNLWVSTIKQVNKNTRVLPGVANTVEDAGYSGNTRQLVSSGKIVSITDSETLGGFSIELRMVNGERGKLLLSEDRTLLFVSRELYGLNGVDERYGIWHPVDFDREWLQVGRHVNVIWRTNNLGDGEIDGTKFPDELQDVEAFSVYVSK